MGTCVSSCIKCYGEEDVNLAADNNPTSGGSVNVGPFASRKPSIDGTLSSPKKKGRTIRKYEP